MERVLFDKGSAANPSPGDVAAAQAAGGSPRLRVPQRDQVEMHWTSLDELLEPDHPARMVWAFVCGLDLSRWLTTIKAVKGVAGRDATDPRLLVALWVYATIEGVGSARELARLCEKHLAYQWLCGGVSLNYHLLADFRSQGGDKWDDLLTQVVASLMAENLVTLQRVAQDGMRVRASAGAASFRRRPRLEQFLVEAREQVEALKQMADESSEDAARRQRAARERASQERQRRLEEAIRNCEELQQQREETGKITGKKPVEARASTTDPEARTMKFPDGGYRPGYNVQFSTDTASGIIVGVDVTNHGTDMEELPPMLDQLEERYDRVPEEALVDGGFASLDAIDDAAEHGCTVYAPLKYEQKQLDAGKNPYAAKRYDSPAVASWRQRMGTEAAKLMYRLRGQTAEWVNAICRNRNLRQMPVRGQPKCRGIAVLYALAHDIVRAAALRVNAAEMSG
jgi:transposase